jgi:putative FmdB family regulatory protein
MYEYQCKACGHRFEVIQKFSDKPVKECPKCGKAVERLVSSPAIQFKGTGWYITDYAKRSGPTDSRSESMADADKETAKVTDSAPSDKSETPGKAKETAPPASTAKK